MKCKNCGQELTIDRETGIGVCPDCGKKYKVSTVVRPKICSDCKIDLVKKDAIWECPQCGKKYVFSSKKSKSEDTPTVSKIVSDESDVIIPTVQPNDSPSNEETVTSSEVNDENVDEIPVVSTENKDTVTVDELVPTEESAESDTVGDSSTENVVPSEEIIDTDIINDEIIDDEPSEQSDVAEENAETEKSTETIQPNENTNDNDEIVEDDEAEKIEEKANPDHENFSVAKHSVLADEEASAKTIVPEIPKLYDSDGNEFTDGEQIPVGNTVSNVDFRPTALSGMVSGLDSMTKTKTDSTKGGRGGLVFAIVFGLLVTLVGVGIYICTLLQSFGSFEPKKEMLTNIATYLSIAFFVLFAVIGFTTLAKPIGRKKVGVAACGIFAIAMLAVLLLAYLPEGSGTKEFLVKNNNIITYGIYGFLIFSTFLTMVISCDTDFRQKANSASIAAFVLSIFATLILALKMLPLEGLNMSILEVALPYIDNFDKVLLSFVSVSFLSVIAKSND